MHHVFDLKNNRLNNHDYKIGDEMVPVIAEMVHLVEAMVPVIAEMVYLSVFSSTCLSCV